jgi:hypothetical protein
MFDYIRCELPLPDGYAGRDLQTKDFNCLLLEHVISKDGRLMLASHRAGEPMVDANYHGLVHFIGSETAGYEPPRSGDFFRRAIRVFHRYSAKFTDGQLVSIDIVRDDD